MQREDVSRPKGPFVTESSNRAWLQVLKLSGGHTDVLECMRFLPGHRLVTRSCDGTMHVWDYASRAKIASYKVGQAGHMSGCADSWA